MSSLSFLSKRTKLNVSGGAKQGFSTLVVTHCDESKAIKKKAVRKRAFFKFITVSFLRSERKISLFVRRFDGVFRCLTPSVF